MVAEGHKSQLKRIKKNIEKSEIYFKPNNERYHEFQKFVFETALNDNDIATLNNFGKPILEFNIAHAPVSRLCGEFSKQEPSIMVMAETGEQVHPEVIEVVESHIRHIFDDAKKHNTQYSVYKDQLSGGFSSFKVWTEYANSMSFDQVIRFGRVYEPTMTGYDPMAREVDKKDAEYTYELYPMTKDEFKRKYPEVDLTGMSFIRMEGAFSWSYSQNNEDIVVLAHYYEKKKRKVKIYKLADGSVKTQKDYDQFMEQWNAQGFIEQPPMVTNERWTEIESICRYELIETEVLEHKETEFEDQPNVFVDGDSVIIKSQGKGTMQQFTRPYVYDVKGIQRLTNFSGQVIANDFESMVMHKFMVAKESIPEEKEYIDALTDTQRASTLVYNAFMDNNPDQPIPPPTPVPRIGLPPEVIATFTSSMQMVQNILGTYDSQLGINDNQLSGVAIVEAATQSNATAMPYIVNYMQSLTQVANIILKLIPKYYVTPRTIPVLNKDGTRDYKKINQPGGISFNYDENALSVRVEAGPNFAIQKSKALQQVQLMSQSNERFGQFMQAVGLDFILENMEFKGADVLKERAKQWMAMEQKKEEEAAKQPNPEVIKAQLAQQQMALEGQKMQVEQSKVLQQAQEADAKDQIAKAQLLIDMEKLNNERIQLMITAGESKDKLMATIAKAHAEEERARADLHIKMRDMAHGHARDVSSHLLDKDRHEHEKEVANHDMKMAEKIANKPVVKK